MRIFSVSLHSGSGQFIFRSRCAGPVPPPRLFRPSARATLRANNNNLQTIRPTSTSAEVTVQASSVLGRAKNWIYVTSVGLVLSLTYLYFTDTRAGVHRYVVVPALRLIYNDAEDAQEAGTSALKTLYGIGLHPRERGDPDARGDLATEVCFHVLNSGENFAAPEFLCDAWTDEGGQVFGHTLKNPIGTSAGLDKHAEISSALFALGPAIVEIGGVTPQPQDGNQKPRVFRLPSQEALVNRYGFNSEGADAIAIRLRQRVRQYAYDMGLGMDADAERKVLSGEAGVPPGSLVDGKLLAVQVGKNKTTPEGNIAAVTEDYVCCVERLAKYSDVVVVNVSSPNTPGLRSLQSVGPLTDILTGVVTATRAVDRKTKPPVMVKVSPDEDSDEQVNGICEAVWDSGVDGVIVGNTTLQRPEPLPKGYVLSVTEAKRLHEQGGYSGPQLFDKTLALVKRYRRALDLGFQASSDSESRKPTALENAKTDSEEGERPQSRDAFEPATYEPPPNPFSSEGRQSLLQLPDRHKSSSNSRDSEPLEIERSVSRDAFEPSTYEPPPKPFSSEGRQPLIQLPGRHKSSSKSKPDDLAKGPPQEPAPPESSSTDPKRKVIFASGGITNGKQALEVIEAGASVAMVYTTLVYGGAGSISRIKREVRWEKAARGSNT
ncbi:MAG: Dihydroorotate dehydrogenase (quinone), mitochondrial [Piccolia ochrophora]|nr:MAG: Dihydroorotate dehydrogenase (quinone), mitochondrial [Piccolia ochrophora]